MKIFLSIIMFSKIIIAADSTATLTLNNTLMKIVVPSEIYIDLEDFQNFLNGNIQDLHFYETIVDDLTGDNLPDTLFNEIYMVKTGCVVKSNIVSNKFLVYSDSILISNDQGNYDNIWGSDSIYYQLFPHSLFYSGYLNRVQSYMPEREQLNDDIFMYLYFKRAELEKMGLSKDAIESNLNEVKKYVNSYKGKFIHNISLSNPDTYIYEALTNKFVIFYSP